MMTEHTGTSLHDLVIRTFATVEAKDLEAMMSLFADDAVVIDPHFPTPQMQGKAVITEAFRGAMSASVSELNRRRWLQVWNASGVILMTIFRFRRVEIVCFFLPPEQVSLRCARNATIFRHFLVLPQAR
jgi:hypothetical protein